MDFLVFMAMIYVNVIYTTNYHTKNPLNLFERIKNKVGMRYIISTIKPLLPTLTLPPITKKKPPQTVSLRRPLTN